MLYETQPYTACSALHGFIMRGGNECLQGKIPGKSLWNAFKKRNEIAFVCACKTTELYH